MPLYDQVELLCQAITSQAKAEVDQVLARAREEADRRLSRGRGQPPGSPGPDQSRG